MKPISIKRIEQLWIQMAVTTKRQVIINSLSVFSALLFTNIGALLSGMNPVTLLATLGSIYVIIFNIYMAVSLSGTFQNMKTKEERIAVLTLPSQNSEKFLATVLWAWIVPVLIFTVNVMVIDVLRNIFLHLASAKTPVLTGYVLPYLIRNLSNLWLFNDHIILNTSAIILLNIFNFSWFTLGSCLWYKRVFLKTIAATGICAFLFIIILISCIQTLDNSTLGGQMHQWFIHISTEEGLAGFTIAVFLADLFILWISYHLFCRRQVISKKWNLLPFISK